MATYYVLEALRNKDAIPGALSDLKMGRFKITNTDSSTHTIIVETGCAYLFEASAKQGDYSTAITVTVAASTLYPGTSKLTFTIPGSGTNGGVVFVSFHGAGVANAVSLAADSTIVAFDA